MTRSVRNWASWSRRRDLRFLVWAANWASTTRSQKSADWLAILRNHAPSRPENQADATQDDDRPAHQGLEPVDDAAERLEKRQRVDGDKENEESRPQQEQSLGGRAGGVDESRAQAVEENRRRERSVQIGEEVDDVEPALNQMAQIIGGERHGFGRALLTVRDQVANDRQPPDQGKIEQTKIAVDGPNERRPRRGRSSRSGVIWISRSTTFSTGISRPWVSSAASSTSGTGKAVDPALQVADDASGKLPALLAVEPSLDHASRMLEFASQCEQPMTVARLGLLRLQGLEQDDVAIEQTRHATDQAIAEPQEDERHPRQPEDRQRHSDKPQRHAAMRIERAGTARPAGPVPRRRSPVVRGQSDERKSRTEARPPGRSRSAARNKLFGWVRAPA